MVEKRIVRLSVRHPLKYLGIRSPRPMRYMGQKATGIVVGADNSRKITITSVKQITCSKITLSYVIPP